MQNHEGAPFTIEVFHIARNGGIVGRSFRLKCSTCGKEQTKDVESLNPLHLQDALKGLFEESRLHASTHVDTKYTE